MLLSIALFEVRSRLREFSPYIFWFILAAISFLAMLSMAGGIGDGVISVTGGGGEGSKVLANSPYNLHFIISYIACFSTSIIAAIMGRTVYKDYEAEIHTLYFTKPITKFQYLGGRYIGSFILSLIVFSGIIVGTFIATQMPTVNMDTLGANHISYYLYPFLVNVIPNLFFSSSIFFMLGALTRNSSITNIGGVLFVVLYMVATDMTRDLDSKTLASLIDPLGMSAQGDLTEYWTSAEKNTLLVPFSSMIMYNRMIWMSIGIALLLFTYLKFNFVFQLNTNNKSKKKIIENIVSQNISVSDIPQTHQAYGLKSALLQLIALTKLEFSSVVKSIQFRAIVACGLIMLFVNLIHVGEMYGTNIYPVTYAIIRTVISSFGLFFIIMIAVFSGEAIWRERTVKINQIYDALPMPNWVSFLSKLFAIFFMNIVVFIFLMIGGILTQQSKGYTHFEIGLYLQYLMGFQLLSFLLIAVVGMFIQTLVNNRYLGNFLMVLYFMLNILYSMMGWNNHLFLINSSPDVVYSDMNKFGHFTESFLWFKMYWLFFALLLCVVSYLYWIRGTEANFKIRSLIAKSRFSKPVLAFSAVCSLLFFSTGCYIYYNTHVLNKYATEAENEKQSVDLEKTYEKYEHLLSPSATDVKIDINLFPQERNYDASEKVWYVNTYNKPLDTLFLNYSTDEKINSLSINKNNKIVLNDTVNGIQLLKLDQPLMPGDSFLLSCSIEYKTKGFLNDDKFSRINFNGTFLSTESGIFPSFGYPDESEIENDDTRKKNGLASKERMPSINDFLALHTGLLGHDAWVRFEATVSTSDDQIAIAPGTLVKDWKENGRHYFHYKMDAPMLNFYAFLSANYEIKKDEWKSTDSSQHNVAIEVYYHKGHEYNVSTMVNAIKKSLDYYTVNFSHYPYKQVRIVEFPRYASFAQSFASTIPFSEGIGFIAKVDSTDEKDVDYPLYVTAHEVGHQWWAHQVYGAKVQGCTMTDETMAQYSALMIMKKEFGKEQMKKFLKYEMNNYLQGRAEEKKKEMPLYLVENQQYIHYNKGSVAMYALQDYIGEDSLNAALRKYIQKVAYQKPPYTTSLEMLSYIEKATPDSLKYIIEDLFKTITLYENKVNDVTYKKLDNGKYEITLNFESKKLRADSLGNEKEILFNDWIDVGVFTEKDAKGKELYFKKHKISANTKEIKVVVDKIPVSAGIDPYNKLIDRHPDDNVKTIEKPL